MRSILYILFFYLNFNNVNSMNMGHHSHVHNKESMLRENLFQNYDKNIRPVLNNEDPINLEFGIEIKSLENFDQKAENIKFNFWVTMVWKDEYLNWNSTEYNQDFLDVSPNDVWLVDLELYNAADKPYAYDSNSVLKLNSDGYITWVRPIIYSFSCHLSLKDFPYDTQSCSMTFGSWRLSKQFLDIYPFNSTNPNYRSIQVSEDFSHNEWDIIDMKTDPQDIEYKCCPGELWPNTIYTIHLERKSTKYDVVIIMSLVLTITAIIVTFIDLSKYTRFYLLVFIPLTIIWLQIHIAGKIPVIEYATSMELFFLNCFYTMLVVVFESGILFNLGKQDIGLSLNFMQKYKNGKLMKYMGRRQYIIDKDKHLELKKKYDIDMIKNDDSTRLQFYQNQFLFVFDFWFKTILIFTFITNNILIFTT